MRDYLPSRQINDFFYPSGTPHIACDPHAYNGNALLSIQNSKCQRFAAAVMHVPAYAAAAAAAAQSPHQQAAAAVQQFANAAAVNGGQPSTIAL